MFSYTKLMQAMAAAGIVAPSDPYFRFVTMLLPGNGTNGAQNNTFLDSSNNNFSVTRNGNTTQGAFSPFFPTIGGWSTLFSIGYIVANSYPNYFGTGDFSVSVEFLTGGLFDSRVIRPIVSIGQNEYMNHINGGGWANMIYVDTSNKLNMFGLVGATTIAANTWYTLVFTKTGTSYTVTLNGVSESYSGTFSVTTTTPANLWVGQFGYDYSWNRPYWNGYISNLQITTSAGVVLNICGTGSIRDSSTNAAALRTVTGVATYPYNPVTTSNASTYTATVYGGSGYFDGTGDSLTFSANAVFALGTGAWTMEAWVYPQAFSVNRGIMAVYGSGGQTDISLYMQSAGGLVLSTTSSQIFNTDSTGEIRLQANRWYHLAVTRNNANGITLWVDGRSTKTATMTQNTTSNQFIIGDVWNGFIAGARLIKGQNIYTANFDMPTAPPTVTSGGANASNVSMIALFANAGVIDASGDNDLETVGNASISSAQSKFGGSSISFDGNGDYLRVQNPNSNIIDWYTGNTTVEYWIYPTSFTQGNNLEPVVVGNMAPTANNNYWSFGPIGSGLVQFYYFNGAAVRANSSFTMTGNTWTHLAMVKVGAAGATSGNITIYANGNLVFNGAISGTPQSSATYPFCMGQAGNASMNAYIQDFRFSRYARYTANFTPTTTAFPLQ